MSRTLIFLPVAAVLAVLVLTPASASAAIAGFRNSAEITIRALSGHDLLCAGRGNDIAVGAGGRDALKGQAGRDCLLGGSGRDRLVGGRGRDTCVGGKGGDRASCEVEKSV